MQRYGTASQLSATTIRYSLELPITSALSCTHRGSGQLVFMGSAVMDTLEFIASIVGTILAAACCLFCLWLFFAQVAVIISCGLGIWFYFTGYPWIGLVVAMVGSLGGCFIQLVFMGKYMEGLQKAADEKDTRSDATNLTHRQV